MILHSYKTALLDLYISLIKDEETLPHQKHDSHPILADYGTDHISIRNNDKGNDIVVKPLPSFSLKSVTPFQTKFKTPNKKNNKTLHQQSLLLKDTDIISDDEDHLYTRIQKYDSSFSTDTTLRENCSTLKKSPSYIPQESTSAINVHTNSQLSHIVHKFYLSMILPFSNTKITFRASFCLMTIH